MVALVATHDIAAAQDTRCALDTVGTGTVADVIDGRSFRLTDGREIRLAGIEVPLMARAGETSLPATVAAKAALESFVAGREVVLKASARETDRYGRLATYVFVGETPAQHFLLAGGHARVSPQGEPAPCRAELLKQEAPARTRRLGLWADRTLGVQDAASAAEIAALRGRFAVVEGKVLSVRSSGATIYMNFGRRWIEGFAVTIRKRDERSFAAADLDPKTLQGKRVRVRGWIDARSGPRIEAARPEQFEVLDVN